MDDIIDYLDMIKSECESPDEKAWIIMKSHCTFLIIWAHGLNRIANYLALQLENAVLMYICMICMKM